MITLAKYQRYEVLSESTFRITIRLTDDVAGVYDHGFIVSGNTLAELKDDASRQIAAMNATLSSRAVLDGIAVNANIPVTWTAPSDTAFETWMKAVRKWQTVKSLLVDTGIKTGSETEIVAIKTAATSGYSAAYLDNF